MNCVKEYWKNRLDASTQEALELMEHINILQVRIQSARDSHGDLASLPKIELELHDWLYILEGVLTHRKRILDSRPTSQQPQGGTYLQHLRRGVMGGKDE